MAKIIAKNKQYTGVSATVQFVKGVGETDKDYLIKWFKDNGYEVIDGDIEVDENAKMKKELNKNNVEELKQLCIDAGIDVSGLSKKSEFIEALLELEGGAEL